METIRSSLQISRVFNEGRRLMTPEISLIALKNDELHDRQGRVAFIAGKKLGNAVWRNSAKRRMREICRKVGGPVSGYDILFVARKRVTTVPFAKLVDEVGTALGKLG